MKSLIIHGVHDLNTLKSLIDLGVKDFAFDLRGESLNLVKFKELPELIEKLPLSKCFLTFSNSNNKTILSALDLLKELSFRPKLILRRFKELKEYEELELPFTWVFSEDELWKEILKLPKLVGVVLSMKDKEEFSKLPELWKVIDERKLVVYLQVDSFLEAEALPLDEEINLIVDLSAEVETSYREIDQEKLKGLNIWKVLNEDSSL